jgi:nitronate monooxygenase
VFDRLRGLDWPQPYSLRTLRNEMTERWHRAPAALEEALAQERARFQAADAATLLASRAKSLLRSPCP